MKRQATIFAVLITALQFSVATSTASVIITPRNNADSTLLNIPAPQEMLREIMNVTGLSTNFVLKEADVLNLEASISQRKRTILYNPAYIDWLNKLSRDKWSVMVLLAHEVGHHLNGHTIRKGGSSPKVELEADEFAGFVLYKLGATLQESQKVMDYIAKVNTSGTHPGRMARKQAIETGWVKAANAITTSKLAVPQP